MNAGIFETASTALLVSVFGGLLLFHREEARPPVGCREPIEEEAGHVRFVLARARPENALFAPDPSPTTVAWHASRMAWIPEPTERLRAFYGPTNNAALDGETTRLEDDLQSFEQIKATCRKYHVVARIIRKGKFIGEVAATGEYTPEPV